MTDPKQTESGDGATEVYDAFVKLGEGETSERYRTLFNDLDEAKRLLEVLFERKYDIKTTGWSNEMGEGVIENLINLETVEDGVYGVVRRRSVTKGVEQALEGWNHEHLLNEVTEAEA